MGFYCEAIMADVNVDVLGMEDLGVVADMYRQVFKPARDVESFKRRFAGRHKPLILVASREGHPVGFYLGFELKPDVFFTWLLGVLPDSRRAGVATQLMDAGEAWAGGEGYERIRFECQNYARPMLQLAIAGGYDVTGLRWDGDLGTNLVIFEKHVRSG